MIIHHHLNLLNHPHHLNLPSPSKWVMWSKTKRVVAFGR
jgi:hypothetical protein